MKLNQLQVRAIVWCGWLGGLMLLCPAVVAGRTLSVLGAPASCLQPSGAVWTSWEASRSLQDCHWRSRQPVLALQSIGFVQFSRRDLSCALYRYKDVCQLLNITEQLQQQPSRDTSTDCEGFVDAEYDVLTANAQFSAVWIGGHGPALENLVCGREGPRNPVVASGVTWGPDGAQMDGVNSSLLVSDSTGFNFTQAFTMVMELRRTPGVQALMELTDCSSYTAMLSHFWEFPGAGQLYLNPISLFALARTARSVLTSSSNEFFKVAVAHDIPGNRTKFFLGSAALAEMDIQYVADSHSGVVRASCLKIGYRSSGVGSRTLNGTVKMAAIAGSYLPDDVVLRFMAGTGN